jgi:two-component system, NtrC family, sensor histidine kinase HydH
LRIEHFPRTRGAYVSTRRLAIQLLAPTVLVSLALVCASILGALYLNQLHLHFSEDLNENVRSTQAAARLELATNKLIEIFAGDLHEGEAFVNPVQEQMQILDDTLKEAQSLANFEREKVLVQQIANGLKEYRSAWETRTPRMAGALSEYDLRIATLLKQRVLQPCSDLRNFNAGQIVESDRDNQRIVNTLRWGLVAVGLGAPLSGLLLGFAVARSLRHSIYQLSVGIRDAAGRLNRELGSVTLEEEGDLPDLHLQLQGVLKEIERVVGQLQQREREVLRSEQLAAVGQVAAGVAHELRNPLTSVKMLVQTGLEGSPATGLPPEDLGVIEHEIRRMEQRIQMFLDFARPPQSERRRTDLLEVLRRARVLVEGRVRRQKVNLILNSPTDPVYLLIDPEQVQQVVVNLLLNALDALPHGGTITVEIKPGTPASATGELGGNMPNGSLTGASAVEVSIQDTGPGIAPRIRERLFEPFVSSKETGVGLGLSISKRLVEAHGGTIRGDDAPEGGAVFAFTLPL